MNETIVETGIQKLTESRQIVIEAVIEWQKNNYPNRTNDYAKCHRDLNLVFDAYISDLNLHKISSISYIASKYWVGSVRQIHNLEVETDVHKFLINYIIDNILEDKETKDRLLFLNNVFLNILTDGPTTGIENLYSKRRQIRAAWDQQKLPSKELIENLLERTLNISSSKQNLFPFKIHAFGPDNPKEKEIIGKICTLYQTGSVNHWDDANHNGEFTSRIGTHNIDQYILDEEGKDRRVSPWILVFESRLAEPNNFVKEYSQLHNDYTRFTQTDEKRFRGLCNTKLTCIEVGMFIQTLAGLCLENDLGISYIRSFPEWQWSGLSEAYKKDGNKHGLDWSSLPCITEQPLMIVQLGHVENVRDWFQSNSKNPARQHWENKPSVSTIATFHSGE